jgi:hypothetical protein
MDDDTLPVGDDEFVLRRVHRNHLDPALPMPVTVAAFRPNRNDTTGISVFREQFSRPEDVLAAIEADKRDDYYVVRLPVAELRKLGLTVRAEPEPGGPGGHSVVPELSDAAYQADKPRLKQVQVELARLASANIVHRPG